MKVAELLENTSKKYAFVDADTRIVALRNFGLVKKGDSGGFIGSERNLSHYGLAWVGGDARVTENALVYGNARVYGDALVYGDAWVTGNARVYGDALVGGDARVYGDAQVCDNARVSGNAQVCDNARVSGNAWVFGSAHVYGAAQVGGTLHVGGQSSVISNERFCKTYLHLESLKDAADPANKDRLLRALLTIYKKNPGTWSAQIGLFIDELRQLGVRYPELAAIQKSAGAD